MPSIPNTARDFEYVPARQAQFHALLALPGFELGSFLEPLLQSLPFKLGESAAETCIPFAFDDALVELLGQAVDDLAELVRRRRENELEPKPAPLGWFEAIDDRKLAPPCYSAGPFASGALLSAAAQRAMRHDPLLDAGVLEAWLIRGKGVALLEQLALLFGQLCEEDLRNGGTTCFLHLGWIAGLKLLEDGKARAKKLVSRLLPWEKLEKTIGFALFALSSTAAEAALVPLASRRLNFDLAGYGLRARAAISPLAACTIRSHALQNDVNPWGLSQALAETLETLWRGLLEDNPSPHNAEQRLTHEIAADPEIRQRAGRAGAVLQLRRHALHWLAFFDGVDPELSEALIGLLGSDEALFKLLVDSRAVQGRLQRFAKNRRCEPAAEQANADLFDVLKRGAEREDCIREVASAFTCLALDRVAAGAIDRACSCLRDRHAEYSRDQLVADYMAGRLYRLSSDPRETRRALTRRSQGHLFIDLKGFTKRTHRAKEIVMAEFLRTEFYEPILRAAAERAGDGAGGQQLFLQNLLGDAAVFSGEMPALVELAQAIQRICRAYGEKLKGRTGVSTTREGEARRAEIESGARAELEAARAETARLEAEIARKLALPQVEREQMVWCEYTHRVSELDARYRKALAARDDPEARRSLGALGFLKRQEKEVFGKVENLFGPARDAYIAEMIVAHDRLLLKELQRRVVETRRAAEALLRALEEEQRAKSGFGLEAGLFITYGAAAEVMEINDPVFGGVKVAIAEKINEAARGTARNGILKARLDALVERARISRDDSRIDLPFRVYVDSAYNLLLPADLNERVDQCVRAKDPASARLAAKDIAETVLRDLARAMGLGDGQSPETLGQINEIYNTGEALSGEALAAYLSSTSAERSWFRKVLSVDELDGEFHDLFCFLADELELVVSVPHDGDTDRALIFRRAGQVQFRGFEAKKATTVFELLRPDSPFCLLLAQKHLALWAAEARSQGVQEEFPG